MKKGSRCTFTPIIQRAYQFKQAGLLKVLQNSLKFEFPSLLSSIPPFQDDEEDVLYDVESLFINILIEETINYITE